MYISTYFINHEQYSVRLGYNEALQSFWLVIPSPNISPSYEETYLFHNMFDRPEFRMTIQDVKGVLANFGIEIPENELQSLYYEAAEYGYFTTLDSQDFMIDELSVSNVLAIQEISNKSKNHKPNKKNLGDSLAFWIFLPIVTIMVFYLFNKFIPEASSKKPKKIEKTASLKIPNPNSVSKKEPVNQKIEKPVLRQLSKLPERKLENKPKPIVKKRDKELDNMVDFIESGKIHDL